MTTPDLDGIIPRTFLLTWLDPADAYISILPEYQNATVVGMPERRVQLGAGTFLVRATWDGEGPLGVQFSRWNGQIQQWSTVINIPDGPVGTPRTSPPVELSVPDYGLLLAGFTGTPTPAELTVGSSMSITVIPVGAAPI